MYLTVFVIVVFLYLISLYKKFSFNLPLSIFFSSLFYLLIIYQILSYENLIILFFISIIYTFISVRVKKISLTDEIITDFIFNFFIFFLSIKLISGSMNIDNLIFLSGFENKISSLSSSYFDNHFFTYLINHRFFINGAKSFFLVYILSFFIILSILINFNKKKINAKKYYFLYLILPAIFFFIESFSTYQFFYREGGGAIAHWQPYVGTIQLISQGGYLLWDTPSQYGFLSILFPYIFSFGSPWQSFYIINALFVYIFSFQVFFIIWNNGNIYKYVIALLASLSLVYYLNAGQYLNNVNQVPSDGSYRFFWFFTTLLVLFKVKEFSLIKQIYIILPLWIIGFLWSPESAFYCTAVVVPFLINFFIKSNLSYLNKIIICLVYPFSIFLILFFISIYYILNLGHLPDFFSFIEFAILWSSGTSDTSREVFNVNGPILLLVFLLSIILLRYKKNTNSKYSYLIFSVFFSLGASSSYLVAQSNDANLNTQLVYFVLGIILTSNLFKWKYYNFVMNPLLIIIILTSFANPRIINHFYNTITNQDYLLRNVYFEKIDEVENILSKINDNNTPVAIVQSGRHFLSYASNNYYNDTLNENLKINTDIWVPYKVAFPLYKSLSNERRITYLRRWFKQRPFERAWYISPIDDIWLEESEKSLIKSLILEKYIIHDQFKEDKFKAILFKKK